MNCDIKKRQFNGRWTKSEHDRFLKGLEKYGKDWEMIQKVVKTRTKTQVRSHAQKVFLKIDKTDIGCFMGFESEEEEEKCDYDSI